MSKMTYEQWQSKYELQEGSTYSEEFRRQFITDYLNNPNLSATCRHHNVPYATAMSWQKKVWWQTIADEILGNFQEDLLAKQRKIIEKSYNEQMDRLENGDEFYYPESGHVRIKVKANHLAAIADSTLKANQLLQGRATSINHVTMDSLADKLRGITHQAIIDITPKMEQIPSDLEDGQNQLES
jgi:transposase-like protein